MVDEASALGAIFNLGMEAAVALKFGLGGIGAAEASCTAGAGGSVTGGTGAAGGGTCMVDEGSTLGAILSFGIAAAVAFKLGLGEIGAAADSAGAAAGSAAA